MSRPTNEILPAEIVESQSWQLTLGSIVGVLVLVFVVNLVAVWILQQDNTNLGVGVVRTKWEMLLSLEQPVDWLILGDSSAHQGVNPEVLNERFGVSSLNLATIGNLLVLNDAWMLDKYIERFGPPRNVVIVHVYDVWHREINGAPMADIPLRAGFWKRLNPRVEFSPRQVERFVRRRYFPLYVRNSTLSHRLLSPTASAETGILANGFTIRDKPNPDSVRRDKDEHLWFVRRNTFALSTPNSIALEHIAALAEKYEFDVYFANSPLYEGLYEDLDFREYYSHVQMMLNDFAKENERLHYVLRDPVTFSIEKMQNVDHVIYEGAISYSEKLVSEIQSLQAAPPTPP